MTHSSDVESTQSNIYQEPTGSHGHCSWCWNTGRIQETLEGARELQRSGQSGRAKVMGGFVKPTGACENHAPEEQDRRVQNMEQNDPSLKRSSTSDLRLPPGAC